MINLRRNEELRRNIEVFLDTKDKYGTFYKQDTDNLIDKNTVVYLDDIEDIQFMPHPKMPNKDMQILFMGCGSERAGLVFPKGRTAVLNFADAITPGGLVEIGETTQEECLCRCSNLYAALTSDKAKPYYEQNRRNGNSIYTDAVIYTRDVLFFKDDESYLDIEPRCLDVITCPSPCGVSNTANDAIVKRIYQIVRVAALNRVDNLILGAWGCGAFGQDPDFVSRIFIEAVKKYNAFENVVFAVPEGRHNFYVFKDAVDSVQRERWQNEHI